MIGIYKIENKINGHCYIGQSIDIERRWRNECQGAFCPSDREYNYPLSRAIRKYGLDNFTFTVLSECSRDELNEQEVYYIRAYNSYFNGYNQTMGGNQTAPIPKDLILQIQQELPYTTESWTQLSQRYKVSDDTISKINRGLVWFNPALSYPLRPTFVPQPKTLVPTRETWSTQMAHDIYELGWRGAAQKYNVSDSGMRHRARSHGWSDKIFEFRNQYRQEVLGLAPLPRPVKQEKQAKPVVQQFDKNMQLINEFDTPSNASRAVLGNESGSSHISQCCTGKRKSAYKFIWRYKSE